MSEYVLLPARGLTARSASLSATTSDFFRGLEAAGPTVLESGSGPQPIRVLDSIREDGAKLVEMSEATAASLRASQPDVIIAPVIYYQLARFARPEPRGVTTALNVTAAQSTTLRIRVTDRVTGDPVEGADVVGFTDFANRFGAGATTNAQGQVELDFGAAPVQLERFYVFPPLVGYWGFFEADVELTDRTIEIEPIDFGVDDALRHFHGAGDPNDGAGVRVGVLDTGAGPHPDLVVDGSEGNGGDIDNGDGHGSHVAGIIASRGVVPNGVGGVAPGVTLKSYRVFSAPGGLARNFTIAKAIDQAVADGCDLINLSLKIDFASNPSGTGFDQVVQFALQDARDAGCLPIAAAGNDGRSPVDFPANDPMALAVSALGRIGTFPSESTEASDIAPPPGDDPANFIADFSNVGPEIDLTGPGVGIVSTVPNGYGAMSGTSMACPAVTGMVARLLAEQPKILTLPRDANRSAEIARLALQSAGSLGFPSDLEGHGIL